MERPSLRAWFAKVALDLVAAGGVPTAPLRLEAGLAVPDLEDPERQLPLDRVAALTNAAAEALGEPALGLRVGESIELQTMGAFAYAVRNAPTLETGLRNLSRYVVALVEGMQSSFEVQGDVAVLALDYREADPELTRHINDAGAMLLLRLIRELAGSDWSPREIWFRHAAPADLGAHTALGSARLCFSMPTSQMCIDTSDMAIEVPDADRFLLPIVERQLEEILVARSRADAWIAKIELAIAKRVCDGHPTIRSIARDSGTSVRTLQRRLGEHGMTYRDLVAAVRHRLALRYLGEGSSSLDEIAFLLGYSELSAFDHAFRRWQGCTPRDYRKQARVS